MLLSNIVKRKSFESVTTAKERLRFVLVSDRANCSPEVLEQMKNDMINVISKYMEIDSKGPEINFTHIISANNIVTPALIANIPLKNIGD